MLSTFEVEYTKQTFNNYTLNDCVYQWDLTPKEKRCLEMADYLIDHKCSLRQLSKEFGLSPSQISWWFSHRLSGLSIEMYNCVRKQLRINKMNFTKGRFWQ